MRNKPACSTLFCFGLFFVQASTATAQDENTVRELLRDCEMALRLEADGISTVDEAVSVARCVATVRGITTVLSYSCWSISEGFSPMFAAEAPPSVEASIQAFVNYARANPASWVESSFDGVITSTMTTFPCNPQFD
jgi:choline-glycine betaine transporter